MAFERSLEENNIRTEIHKFSSVRCMKACLKRGIGFTLCPEISVTKELKQNELVRLTFKGDHDEASLIMIRHLEKWCSPLLTHFMEISEAVIA